MCIYDNISLISSYNAKCFGQICIGNQNLYFVIRTFYFESCVVYEMWKNMADPDSPQMIILKGA
jgi:hypothetical protein